MKGTRKYKRNTSAVWLITGLVAVLSLVAAACGGDAEEETTTTRAAAEATTT